MSDAAPPEVPRRADLDLLRVLLCGAVLLIHALMVHAEDPRYHVKAPESWWPATLLSHGLRVGALAGFFALAGWGSVGALRRRRAGRFLGNRAARLFVPLAAGLLILGPVIKYIELGQGRDLRLAGFRLVEPLAMPFGDFLPRYLTRLSLLTWSHLWFLAYLLLLTVLLLPMLAALARRAPLQRVPSRAAIWLPGLGLGFWLAVSGGYWPALHNLVQDWANLGHFALCFLAGAVLASWPGLEARLRAEAWTLAGLFLAGLAGLLLFGPSLPGRIAVGICAWGAIGAGFGLVGRYPPRPSAALRWLADATLPVFVLHHLPLLAVAVALLPLGLPPALAIALTVAGGATVALALHGFLVLPQPALRRLMGLPSGPPALPDAALQTSRL
ncbi:acyltransferase family protein [Roseomonas hellenica]|uniref:Acyltransferase family protein n=1 Tax=Plastoroseomonas hellenica TaxID=2687306 RepID=A0ABS5EZN8_9PROT|nr:acyltransferase family protein [Plastoroseomonas hellenica]